MSREEFYARVTELLSEKGWTQYRLAKEANVSMPTIYNSFSEHADLQFETFMAIIEGLNVPISVFFNEKDTSSDALTLAQSELLEITRGLSADAMRRIIAYAQAIKDSEK